MASVWVIKKIDGGYLQDTRRPYGQRIQYFWCEDPARALMCIDKAEAEHIINNMSLSHNVKAVELREVDA